MPEKAEKNKLCMDLRVPSAELPTIDTMMKKYNFTFTESKKYIFYAVRRKVRFRDNSYKKYD